MEGQFSEPIFTGMLQTGKQTVISYICMNFKELSLLEFFVVINDLFSITRL